MPNYKLIAEFIGTFTLSLVVLLSVSSPADFPLATPLLAALTLGIFVYTIGAFSGCHINPAVTFGLLSIKRIKAPEALQYIATQIIAGFAALFLATGLGITIPIISSTNLSPVIFELIGMTIFTFGIASIVHKMPHEAVTGVVIGGSLLLGISISALGGAAGILNPAVAIALKTTNLGYYLAQLIGAYLGFNLYQFLAAKH